MTATTGCLQTNVCVCVCDDYSEIRLPVMSSPCPSGGIKWHVHIVFTRGFIAVKFTFRDGCSRARARDFVVRCFARPCCYIFASCHVVAPATVFIYFTSLHSSRIIETSSSVSFENLTRKICGEWGGKISKNRHGAFRQARRAAVKEKSRWFHSVPVRVQFVRRP